MTTSEQAAPKRAPIFSLIAGAVVALMFFTPMLLLSMVTMAAVGLAVVGAFRKEVPRFLPYLAGGAAVVVFLMAEAGSHHGGLSLSPPPKASQLYADATWDYGGSKDEMRGTTSKWATLDSPTDVTLASPYDNGINAAHLQVFKPDNIIFTITQGQVICHSEGTVSVKFDDGPVEEFPCSTPDNGDSKTLYINDNYRHEPTTKPFDKMTQAKKMVVEVELYDNGTRQFTFNVAGLNLTKL